MMRLAPSSHAKRVLTMPSFWGLAAGCVVGFIWFLSFLLDDEASPAQRVMSLVTALLSSMFGGAAGRVWRSGR